VFSEMAASGLLAADGAAAPEPAAGGRSRTVARLSGEGLPLSAAQLVGREPEAMARAAEIAEAQGASLIDINMGCPAKKLAAKNGGTAACGAALMRDEGLALEIIQAVLGAVSVPVSVKMRLGWDAGSINAPSLARKAAEAGVAMVTVHARTREEFYNGEADWAAARQVREQIAIPLIINGDITDALSAAEAMRLSGADGVMIGRAGSGQPWLAGEIAGQGGAPENMLAYIIAHYRSMLEHYGEARGLRHARKHIDWYLQKQAGGFYTLAERTELLASRDVNFVEKQLAIIFIRRELKKSQGRERS